MRHRKAGVKLNRTSSHRKAMFRNMVTSLLKYERIQTTDTKAKEIRRWADHVITLAKRGDLHARRQVLSIVRETDVVHKLFEEAAERFGAMEGGYTRIVKVGRRRGDAAPVSIIELVGPAGGKPRRRRKKKKKSTPPAAVAAPLAAAATDESAEQQADEAEGGQSSRKAEADEPGSAVVSEEDQSKSAGAEETAGEGAADEVPDGTGTESTGADDAQATAASSDETDEGTDNKA